MEKATHKAGAPEEQIKIAVAIASAGRRDILAGMLPHINMQIRKPDAVIICAPNAADIPQNAQALVACDVTTITTKRGLCCQRNEILTRAGDMDIVLFLDDDFLMVPDYIANLAALFSAHRDVVMSTGKVEADGISGPGYSVEDGFRLLAYMDELPRDGSPQPTPVYNGYGCNMAVRMSAVRAQNARFDENLPLYGWLEDVDFSRQIAKSGRIVRSLALRGIHLGTKTGRSPGERLGYSQIANPIYLVSKDTMSLRLAGIQIARNLIANTAKQFNPEPWVDRRGRLRGNVKAIADLARGKLAPQNILAMD